MAATHLLGVVTAYGAAKSAGYQGTYQQFCEEMAAAAEQVQTVATLVEHVNNLEERVTALEERNSQG